jgi:YVTN family beta-propeller protein
MFDLQSTVSVIDTASRGVVDAVVLPLVNSPLGVAVTPDGKHAYVTNGGSNTVSVIDTASNTVVATVPVGKEPSSVAITPDVKHAYVGNAYSGTVSVIDTATNVVVVTVPVPVGDGPSAVGIIPDIPFSAFSAKLAIDLDHKPNHDAFRLRSGFTLGSASNGLNPVAEPVILQVGTFATTIPSGSFKGTGFGPFTFEGVINGAALKVLIEPTGAKRYALRAAAQNANLTGTVDPVTVRVSIGVNSGTSVTALVTLVADDRSKAGPSTH